MYQANGTSINNNFYRYRENRQMHRTEGVFPTRTMRLHKRLVGWHRKRRIPVRDADKPSTLSAYLIDPKYLENGEVITPSKESPQSQRNVPIPVYQYSRITHDGVLASPTIATKLIQNTERLQNNILLWLGALGSELKSRYQALALHRPRTQYEVSKGVLPWWRRKITTFVMVTVTSAVLVGLAMVGPEDSGLTQPVSGNPSNSQSADNPHGAPGQFSSSDTNSPSTTSQSSSEQQPSGTSASQASMAQRSTGTTNPSSPTTNPVTGSSPSTPYTPPTTVTPEPAPTGTTQPTDPLTSTVNGLLSTQINVTVPLTKDSDPIIQTPNITVGL
jgi:hypothetical protein